MALLSNLNTHQSNVIFTSFAKEPSLQKEMTSNADFTMNTAINFELPPNDSTQLLLMTTAKDFQGVFNGAMTWSFAKAAIYDSAFINAITQGVTLNYVVAIFSLTLMTNVGPSGNRRIYTFNCPYILRVEVDPGDPTFESRVRAYVYCWTTTETSQSSGLGSDAEIAYPPTQSALAAAVINCINVNVNSFTGFLPVLTDFNPPNITIRFSVDPFPQYTVLSMGWTGGRLACYYRDYSGGPNPYIVNEAIQNTIDPLPFPTNNPNRNIIAFRTLGPQLSYPPDTRYYMMFPPLFGKYPLQDLILSNLAIGSPIFTQILPLNLSTTFSTRSTAPAWEMPLINANLCLVGLPLPTTPQLKFNTLILFPPGDFWSPVNPLPKPTRVQYFAPDYVQCYRLMTLVTNFTPTNDLYPRDARHPRYGYITPCVISDYAYHWLPPSPIQILQDIYSRFGSVSPPPWRNVSYESPYSNVSDSLFTVARRFETLRFTLKPMFAPFVAQLDADDELEMTFGFLSLAGAKNQAFGRTYRKRR